MKKRGLFLLILAVILLASLPSVLGANILDAAFRPFSDFRTDVMYAKYGPFLDFIAYLLLFIGVTQFAFSKAFGENYSGMISITLALILAIAASVFAATRSPPFTMLQLGPYALALFLIFLAVMTYNIFKGLGVGGSSSVAWAFVIAWAIFTSVGHQIIAAFTAEDSMISSIYGFGNIIFLIALITALSGVYRMFKSGAGDTSAVPADAGGSIPSSPWSSMGWGNPASIPVEDGSTASGVGGAGAGGRRGGRGGTKAGGGVDPAKAIKELEKEVTQAVLFSQKIDNTFNKIKATIDLAYGGFTGPPNTPVINKSVREAQKLILEASKLVVELKRYHNFMLGTWDNAFTDSSKQKKMYQILKGRNRLEAAITVLEDSLGKMTGLLRNSMDVGIGIKSRASELRNATINANTAVNAVIEVKKDLNEMATLVKSGP